MELVNIGIQELPSRLQYHLLVLACLHLLAYRHLPCIEQR